MWKQKHFTALNLNINSKSSEHLYRFWGKFMSLLTNAVWYKYERIIQVSWMQDKLNNT